MNAAQQEDISDAVKRVPTVADEVTRRTVGASKESTYP